jgi:hypothetical protein
MLTLTEQPASTTEVVVVTSPRIWGRKSPAGPDVVNGFPHHVGLRRGNRGESRRWQENPLDRKIREGSSPSTHTNVSP